MQENQERMSKECKSSTSKRAQAVTGMVLAGGRGSRMGGVDKGLVELRGHLMIEWVVERLAPQVTQVFINVNRSNDQYAELGYPIIADATADFRGPLAGIAAVLASADTPWIATVPCDSPLVTPDLVDRLKGQVLARGARVAVAHDGNRLQPVFMLLHSDLLTDLEIYLESGARKIDCWLERHSFEIVDFSDNPEMFMNANTPADLEAVVGYLADRDIHFEDLLVRRSRDDN